MVVVEHQPRPKTRSHPRLLYYKVLLFVVSISFVLVHKYHSTNFIINSDKRLTSGDNPDGIYYMSDQFQTWRNDLKNYGNDVASAPRLKMSDNTILKSYQEVHKCHFVMIDLGSNVGDALHKFIDSFLPTFIDKKRGKEGVHYFFNTTNGGLGPANYEDHPFEWLLPEYVREKITSFNEKRPDRRKVYPEDYCFYGVEGNPHFTPILEKLERNVRSMKPPPVRDLYFLTEHVASSINGPTTLYLDTVNVERNFWGSSVLQSHVDVKKSSGRKKNKQEAHVMGITLTKLLEQTTVSSGHVIIKIDIEGAEYQLLEEAVKSQIFCHLVKDMGITVDIIVEYHSDQVIGSDQPRKRWEEEIKGEEAITNCGASYRLIKSIIPIW